MIRIFGLGPRAKKFLFGCLGWDLRPKMSANSRKSVKTALGNMTVFGPILGADHFVPKKESVF